MRCPNCDYDNPDYVASCLNCGYSFNRRMDPTQEKICPHCEGRNDINARICIHCKRSFVDKDIIDEQEENNDLEQGDYQTGKKKKKKSTTNTINIIIHGLIVVVLILIIMVGSKVIKEIMDPDNTHTASSTTQAMSTTTQAKPATTQAKPATTQAKPATTQTKPATTQAKPATTKAKPATTQAKPKQTLRRLPYTDNAYVDLDACTKLSNYTTVMSGDGSFTFGYPKSVFSGSEADDKHNEYNLYNDSGFHLKIYKKATSGSPWKSATRAYNQYKSKIKSGYYTKEPKKMDSKGYVRSIVGGFTDKAKTKGFYGLCAANESQSYYMEFTYPDPDSDNFYSPTNYIVDCLYRYCSFSGGSYKPRSYKMFLKDDMGEKK